jgi:hypothetical protein
MVPTEVTKIQERLNGLLEKYKCTHDHSERRNLMLAARLAIAEINSVDDFGEGRPASLNPSSQCQSDSRSRRQAPAYDKEFSTALPT